MAEVILNGKSWLDQYEMSGYLNAMSLELSAPILDSTVFNSTAALRVSSGVKSTSFSQAGYWESAPDGVLFSDVAAAGLVLSCAHNDGTEGEIAYSMTCLAGQYSPGAAHGELFAFSVSGESDGNLARGTIMHNAARTASGNGTAAQLGAVSATQKVYASIHVVSASVADTLDVVIQSDDNGSFTSATNRLAFSQFSAAGAEIVSAAGPVADDYWRVSWVLAGDSPDFEFVVIVGIINE